jgi:hypothetical protein
VTRAAHALTSAAHAPARHSDGELPNDLTCEKDGFFIAGFERAGAARTRLLPARAPRAYLRVGARA